MRAPSLALALALLAVPGVLAEDGAVAWFAAHLGVPAEDLPATFTLRTFHVAEGALHEQVSDVDVRAVAAMVRAGACDAATQGGPENAWAGVGVGLGGAPGVAWSGAAVGPRGGMACATYQATPTHLTHPLPSGGRINATAKVTMPAENFYSRVGTATLQTQVLPAPAVGPVAVAAPEGAEADLLGGHGGVACADSFSILVTVGFLRGDGALRSRTPAP